MTPEVLLIGSSPFGSAEEFISAATRNLGSHLRRVPDGETEQRNNFIAWQHSRLPIELVQLRWGGQPSLRDSRKKYTVEDIKPVGYDDQAMASYATFRELKASGVVPPDMRFQVCLPTPMGVVRGFIVTEFCSTIEPLYEERMVHAIQRIQAQIPASELSIQFDLPFEVAMFEVERGRLQDPDSYWESYFSPIKAGIIERITNLVGYISPDVELGLHLCYGDFAQSHFVEPASTDLLVEMANDIVKAATPVHQIKYIQMPVPKDRDDEQYFEPLKRLAIGDTQLFLGLIHPNDEAGTRRRIEAASRSSPVMFGLTTECGLGRATVQDANSVFEIAATVLKGQ
ncbi:MAG: hypothetical protein LQ343_002492 [Gyalolechia ehrenbergii]|nr:MAG: hypothetical protein LQ343_002492 [Gyalolechia ehrenbergii]